MFITFCLLRNEFRYFKLSRIRDLKILDENFEDSYEDVVLIKKMEYKDTVHVKLKFDRKVAFRVYDEMGDIKEDEEGNLYAEIELPNDYNLYNYIFSFGESVEVLEPIEIRNNIRDMGLRYNRDTEEKA